MNGIRKTFAIARDEVLRLPSTRRGLLSLAAFALIWLAIMLYALVPAANLVQSGQSSGLAELIFVPLGLSVLAEWPAPSLALYWILGLYLFPFFTVMTAADQTASDRSRGTLRFFALRCSRLDIFLGRFLGQFFVQCLLVLTTLASVLILIAIKSPDLLSASLERSPVIIVNLALLLLPYTALMAAVSVMAKSARQATLFAMMAWIIVSIVIWYVQRKYGEVPLLDWVLPGSQITHLRKLFDWQTLNYALIPLVHTVVLLGFGAFMMHRRDL